MGEAVTLGIGVIVAVGPIVGVGETSRETIVLIADIKKLMFEFKNILRDNYKFYSQDLLNNLFKHPYTKIEFLVNELNVSRITAANYLNKLAKDYDRVCFYDDHYADFVKDKSIDKKIWVIKPW